VHRWCPRPPSPLPLPHPLPLTLALVLSLAFSCIPSHSLFLCVSLPRCGGGGWGKGQSLWILMVKSFSRHTIRCCSLLRCCTVCCGVVQRVAELCSV